MTPTLTRTLPPKQRRMQMALDNPNAITAEKCRRSFTYFMRKFWDVICTDDLIWNWHLDYIANEITKMAVLVSQNIPKKYDLIINVPPGTTKTNEVSVMFPVWCWTRWEWMRFITGSYSSALSLESAEKSRDIVRSSKFKRYFPELRIQRDKDVKSNFKLERLIYDVNGRVIDVVRGGSRYSTSVGGSALGFHGHFHIVDDPIDPKHAITKVGIDGANYWIDNTLSQRKVDRKVTPLILIMQRLAQNDPTAHLQEKGKKIKHICLPGEINTPDFRKQLKPASMKKYYIGGLLDVKRFDQQALDDAEADLGQYGFAAQVGQNPVPAGGGMFKVDRFVIVDQLPAEVNFLSTVRYWDKAATEDDPKAAYTVGVKMAKLAGTKWIVTDVQRGQWSTDVREAMIRSTAEADGDEVVIGLEQEPGSSGKDVVNAEIDNLVGFAAYADRPTGDKTHRADPYSVQVNRGNVLLLRGEWNHEYIEECRFFPHSTHRDQIDASSGAFKMLINLKEAGPI